MDLAQAIAAAAKDDRGELLSGFLSKHIGADRQYNEQNSGLGYRSPEGWMIGGYKNSLNRPSFYAGKEFQTDIIPNKLAAALMVGGVTGYDRPINPLALPALVYQMDKDRALAAALVPPVKGVTPATLALQLRRKF